MIQELQMQKYMRDKIKVYLNQYSLYFNEKHSYSVLRGVFCNKIDDE